MPTSFDESASHDLILIIPGPPIPWKAPYVSTRGAFSVRTAVMRDFKKIAREQYKEPLIEKNLTVDLLFYMPIPKSTSQKKRAQMLVGTIRPGKRPDRTNLAKLYEDVLIGTVIADDAQIVGGFVEKWYSADPRAEIRLRLS